MWRWTLRTELMSVRVLTLTCITVCLCAALLPRARAIMAAPPSQRSAALAKGAVIAGLAAIGTALLYRWWRTPRSVRPGINAPFAAAGEGHAFLERFEVESREI